MAKDYPVCYVEAMSAGSHPHLPELESIVAAARDRQSALEEVAARIRSSGDYRWVGLYDVDHAEGLIRNLTWSGPGGLPVTDRRVPHISILRWRIPPLSPRTTRCKRISK